ncbi:MAG TPA: YciI family protein [Candidatus Dormibacteraeota bacterium]|nr:YciI family protein [Candidatus Dormibacteraeota bacterium]
MRLDAYTVVFLRRPAGAPEMSDEALEGLQHNHLAFWARLREEGRVLVNGPFMGQPDPSLRGVAVLRTSVEDASRLAHQDPSVRAGRLTLEIFRWLVPHGALGDRPAETVEQE